MQLLSEHNLRVLVRLCEAARRAIVEGSFAEFAAGTRERLAAADD